MYKIVNGACKPLRVHTVVMSVQHSEDITIDEMRKQLKEIVIKVCYNQLSCNKDLIIRVVCVSPTLAWSMKTDPTNLLDHVLLKDKKYVTDIPHGHILY